MKPRPLIAALKALALVSVLSTLHVMGAVDPNAGDLTDVELSMSTDKKTYVPYEPVVVTFTLRNSSSRNIDIGSVSYGIGTIRLEIADEEKIYRSYATGPESLTYGQATRRRVP